MQHVHLIGLLPPTQGMRGKMLDGDGHFCWVIWDKTGSPLFHRSRWLKCILSKHVSESALSLTPSDLKFCESSALSTKVLLSRKDKGRFTESVNQRTLISLRKCFHDATVYKHTQEHAHDQRKAKVSQRLCYLPTNQPTNPPPHSDQLGSNIKQERYSMWRTPTASNPPTGKD